MRHDSKCDDHAQKKDDRDRAENGVRKTIASSPRDEDLPV